MRESAFEDASPGQGQCFATTRWSMVLAAGHSSLPGAHEARELKHFPRGEEAGRSYADVATRLGFSESAVKSAIWRLRQRHRDLLREEIAQTVATPAEVDEEIRYLISMMSG